MDFAKKILNKYGWKDGEGLGKNKNGIAKPLKASLKFDNAGLGVDRATEFNDHWWERCFNEAANNVSVETSENGNISMALKEGADTVEISTKSYSLKKLRRAKEKSKNTVSASYDNFLQSAMLTQSGNELPKDDRIVSEDIAVTGVKVLTDEELFRACGGRTAHKGARHGLNLSGKLARLEEQEKAMLAVIQCKAAGTLTIDDVKAVQKDKKGKKQKGSEEEVSAVENVSLDQPVKKRKMHKKREANVSDHVLIELKGEKQLQAEIVVERTKDVITEEYDKVKKRKRKKQLKVADMLEGIDASETSEEPNDGKEKKKKHSKRQAETPTETILRKKKKKKQ